MRRFLILVVSLLLSTLTAAARTNPADYPLRVHIFSYNAHSHYFYRQLDAVDGEGRANLYENSEPRGFDFSYQCSDRLRTSPGFETYMARWKKPGQSLEILLPVFGKPGTVEGCELKVIMKDTAYARHNGLLGEEPSSVFKAWMVKYRYDPEHGLNEPVRPEPQPAAGQAPTAPANPAAPAK